MQADRIDLYRLFDSNVSYVAPLFQRPYVWTQERNWEPLWKAALGVAEQRLDNPKTIRPHFMGAIVLNQVATSTGAVPARELIDGQQRLTTLQILLAVLRDLAQARGFDRLHRAFHRLVENDAPLATKQHETYKVWPTNADREAFIAALTQEKSDGTTASKISQAYHYFMQVATAWIGEEDAEHRMLALHSALHYDLHIVAIDLDDNDDPQLIFETLNALGTPLLPADLVKNFLFHQAAAEEASAITLYERYWHDFDDDQDFWRAEVSQGRYTSPRIDHFLRHYLSLHTGNDVLVTRLFPTFKAYAASSSLSVEEHLKQFHAYAVIYRRFHIFPADSPEGIFFYRLGLLETTTIYPLLLEIYHRLGSTEKEHERLEMLADFESLLVRRQVCGLTTKNYNNFFLEILSALRDDFTPDGLRRYLLSRESDTARWPDDDEFRSAWTNRQLYRYLVRRRLRMILEALEMALRTEMTEDLPLPPKLTVEHIMPQQWLMHWPLSRPNPGDERSRQERANARNHILQTIGNLTLVTRKLNPSLSNGTWAKKRLALRKHSALTMNRELEDQPIWNEATIEQRSIDLYELARHLWSYPVSTETPHQSPQVDA
jgi:uncharacterized protein with ParB-like and HNH nuclease domain